MESENSTVITNRIPEMDTKIEIKEEPWWIERSSTEVKDEPDEALVSDAVVKTETKVITDGKSSVKRMDHLYLADGGPMTAKPLSLLKTKLLQSNGSVMVNGIEEVIGPRDTKEAQIQVISTLPEVSHSKKLTVQPKSTTVVPSPQQQQQSAATGSRKDLTCRRSSSIRLLKRRINRNRPAIESSVLQAFRESSENLISSLTKIADTMEEANKIRARNLELKIEMAKVRGIDDEI